MFRKKTPVLDQKLISIEQISEELQAINKVDFDHIRRGIREQSSVLLVKTYDNITPSTKTDIEAIDRDTFNLIFKAPAHLCPCWSKQQAPTNDDIINKNAYLQLLNHLKDYYKAAEKCKTGHCAEDEGNLAEALQSITDCLQNQFTTTQYSDQLLAGHPEELRTLTPAITVVTTPAVDAQPAASI